MLAAFPNGEYGVKSETDPKLIMMVEQILEIYPQGILEKKHFFFIELLAKCILSGCRGGVGTFVELKQDCFEVKILSSVSHLI